MPLLPRKNTLDFNPDGTILASKKIKNIALENLKNPISDPDQKTLSIIDAERRLDESFDKLEEMAGQFHSLVLRIQNLMSARTRGAGLSGGSSVAPNYGGLYDDANSVVSSAEQYLRRVGADRQRFRAFYGDDDRNSFATPASSRGYVDDEDLPSVPPSGRQRRGRQPQFRSPDYQSEPSGDDDLSTLSVPEFRDTRGWTSLIFHLIQITRRMDIVVNSRIRPAITKLKQKKIDLLNKIYLMVYNSYDDLIMPFSRRLFNPRTNQLTDQATRDPYTGVRRNVNPNVFQRFGFGLIDDQIIAENEYGDEILNTFNAERQKLLLDLSVVINSWKQNTPTGQQTEFNEMLVSDFQRTAEQNKNLMEGVERGLMNDEFILRADTGMGSVGDEAIDDTADSVGAGRRRGRGRPKKTGRMTMIGCGRNFYGEQINNSRDLPCLLSIYRDCPTKYLL